ncbi:MAG: SusC/RagA family TonB-linked outer membrane protein [Muribaculaceae bacterium]|nr:SusC/RagA family TonB-linked outer membrane protein [Muribaculaceae bacterium]
MLKSASATAIYGSRASNGVIIITTKTGKSGRPQVNFAANFFVNTPRNYVNMMEAGEFRDFIRKRYGEESDQYLSLGTANTNWQKEVLRTSFSHDYSLSVGGTAGFLPYRVAVGYTDNQGIIKTSGMKRLTGSINLTPKFFDGLLSVNANVKGAYVQNRYDGGGLGAAVTFNPTLPVHSDAPAFNNWTTYVSGGGIAGPNSPGSSINTLMATNPVAQIEEYNERSKVYQSVGNLQIDLKMPFLNELRANLNLGYDYSHGESYKLTNAGAPNNWNGTFSVRYDGSVGPDVTNGDVTQIKNGYGTKQMFNDENLSTMLDFYLNYNKTFDAIHSDLDVTAGYSWQHFKNQGHNASKVDPAIVNCTEVFELPTPDGGVRSVPAAELAGYQYAPTSHYAREYQLVSFFGRLNYTFMDRYMLTATVRRDGTSRFAKENRWGTYPAVAVGWRIIEENFMQGAKSWMNDLKIRFDYGITGQQGLDNEFFPYLPQYYTSTNLSGRYPLFGNWNSVVFPFTPSKFNAGLKWESTTTYNVGIDFGFLNNRINGSIEYYVRKTKDLLVEADYAAGSNLSNVGIINGGDLENVGIEFNINTRPIVTKDFTWTSNLNFAWNKNKITRLAEGYDGTTGGIGDALRVQKHTVGEPAYSFYVYEQVYDNDGNPLEGVYVDQNGDGVITKEDRILYHSPTPAFTATWSNTFTYKNWDLGFVLRGNFDNWAYNQTQSGSVFPATATATTPVYNIMSDTYLFNCSRGEEVRLSNYFVQNASFVRCDNITLGYTWQNLIQNKLRLRLFAAVQNPFVITKYKGLDPEVSFNKGLDNSPYPRPVQVSLGVVATF